ncbi:MAG: radical SAM protein [Deltaproteobacteria bacterium]|nr:radical SAM protein [Deltaproteobacteria bacterium]
MPGADLRRRFNLWAWRHYVDLEAGHPRLSYLFWEATLACNLACRHCGSDCHRAQDTSAELTGDEVVRAFDRVASDFGARSVFLAVTGGEPLVRPDLFEVMERLSRLGFPWGMVTNGWSVDDRVVEACRRTRMRTLVVSLDGVDAESHDWLRGRGSFDRAVEAIGRFRRAAFLRDLQVTSTFHRRNIRQLQPMFDLLVRLGVRDWRIVSVFPNGRARRQDDFLLDPAELRGLLEFIRDKRSRPQPIRVSYGDEGFLGCEYERQVRDFFFACLAGIRIASILANGDISGCPNIPRSLVQGNVRTETLKDVWVSRFRKYRDRRWMRQGGCAGCGEFAICKGNSMHLWDSETGGPKLCHLRILDEARKAGCAEDAVPGIVGG